jgi:glutamyl-tRNA reductase
MDVDIKLMDELWDVVGSHDVVYTSTSASGCLITKDEMNARGISQPLVLVDISVPRNVEPECSERDGTYAYNVDHLKEVVDRNTAMRRKQIIEVRALGLGPPTTLDPMPSWT